MYAAFEWLRDDASPFDAMTACRLQSPNWWRTARDALAAARVLLDGPPESRLSASQTDLTADDQAWLVAGAVLWAFEAAVALRLPYGALQAAETWSIGWSGACREITRAGEGQTLSPCRAVLAAAGMRCRREAVTPDRLAAALDRAAHARSICYTQRQKPA